jgi:hypothetical protein
MKAEPTMTYRVHPPVHPGEILREEFMHPLTLTPYALAKRLGIVRTRIERLVKEETSVTPIRHYASARHSVRRLSSGSISRRPTTSRSPSGIMRLNWQQFSRSPN